MITLLQARLPRAAAAAALSLALGLPACGAEPASEDAIALQDADAAGTMAESQNADAAEPLPLTVPINAVMVALVDFSADGIWRPAASEEPLDDRAWLLAEQDAINLIASATLITTPGTGAGDAEWVADPDWRRYALDMRASATQALEAIGERDQARLSLVGDALVETCEDCHQEFKPGLPQMGITRFPYYPKREGE